MKIEETRIDRSIDRTNDSKEEKAWLREETGKENKKKGYKGKNGKRKGPIGESIISTMPELREGRRRFSSQL